MRTGSTLYGEEKAMEFKGGKTRKGQNGPQEKNIQVVVRCR